MSVVFQIKWRMHHVANGLAEVTVYDRFVEISNGQQRVHEACNHFFSSNDPRFYVQTRITLNP